MAQLTASKNRVFEAQNLVNSQPVDAAVIIYAGSAVGQNPATGGNRQLATGGADVFAGFARDNVDNSLGVLGDKDVELDVNRQVVLDVVGLVATTPIGTSVYAIDGDSFTLTSTSNTLIGTIKRRIAGIQAVVEI